MSNWTAGSFLFWLAVVIIVPGLVIQFTLGRKGGHHLYDKDKLSQRQIKNIPYEMIKKRTVWGLKGSASALVTLALVALLYPLACLLGLPTTVLGISRDKLFLFTAIVLVFLIRFGPILYRKFHDQ